MLSRLDGKLTIHFVPDPDDSCAGFLLMKDERAELRATHLVQLPVTEREREILTLVAAGKTNGEIAAVLAISDRTVQKHLRAYFSEARRRDPDGRRRPGAGGSRRARRHAVV